jgi:hypothetical protein
MTAQTLMWYAGEGVSGGEKGEDDDLSSRRLFLWREGRRTEVNARGLTIAWKPANDQGTPQALTCRTRRTSWLTSSLLHWETAAQTSLQCSLPLSRAHRSLTLRRLIARAEMSLSSLHNNVDDKYRWDASSCDIVKPLTYNARE